MKLEDPPENSKCLCGEKAKVTINVLSQRINLCFPCLNKCVILRLQAIKGAFVGTLKKDGVLKAYAMLHRYFCEDDNDVTADRNSVRQERIGK